MEDWPVAAGEILTEAISNRWPWVDLFLLTCAAIEIALCHWVSQRRFCGPDRRILTVGEAAKYAKWTKALAVVGLTSLVAVAVLVMFGDFRSENGGRATVSTWLITIALSLLVALMSYGIVLIVRTLLGKDTWPYTVKGPLRSTAEDMWLQEAAIEYAKKVPYPGTAPRSEDPREGRTGTSASAPSG